MRCFKMIKRTILLAALLLCLTQFGLSVKLHTFPDLVYPSMFVVDNEYIYFFDHRNPNNKMYIYDRNDFKLVKALLKKGEGPREVILYCTIAPTENKINVFNDHKLILYSKKFEYLNEIRLTFSDSSCVPVKDRYIVSSFEGDGDALSQVYALYHLEDNRLEKMKDLFRLPLDMRELTDNLIVFTSKMAAYKDKVFIATGSDLHIEVYNEQGKKLYAIEKQLKKLKPEEKYRERVLEEFKVHYGSLYAAANLEKRLRDKKFSKPLPDMDQLYAGKNRLYIRTYDIKGDEDKYLIMDFKGNIIAEKWLPKTFGEKRYFFDNCYYYLWENDDGEGWELHMIELK